MLNYARDIKSAVITGPTGAIGIALCENLLNKGIAVFAVCRPNSPRIAALPKSEHLQIVPCDAQNMDALPELIQRGSDAFFHLAWADTIGPGRNNMASQVRNIQYTIDAANAAKALGCKVFLGAGSQAEYGRVEGLLKPETPCFPENGYGMAKLCAGQMSRTVCEMLGLDHVWVRILSVYGPRDGEATMITSTIRKLLAGKKPSLTPCKQLWDYLYAADAAEALYLAAVRGRSGAVYPLGSGQALPLLEYVGLLRDAVDPDLPLGIGDIPYGPRQIMHLQADITFLKSDTGFVPRTSFAEGIQKTVSWIKEDRND